MLALAALGGRAAGDAEGRWAGRASLPGRDLDLVVDLAREPSGAWVGSLTVRGFDVKGAPLGNIAVGDAGLAFDAGDALGAPPDGAAFKGRIDAQGAMTGTMSQAGNTAPFRLERVGAAQVDAAPRSTPVAHATEGRWVGRFELGGYPRDVTLDIANQGAAMPQVDFVVVGKATTKLPIDRVAEEDGVLRIESRAYRFAFEGRVRGDRIDGTLELGPTEMPLVLQRAPGKSS